MNSIGQGDLSLVPADGRRPLRGRRVPVYRASEGSTVEPGRHSDFARSLTVAEGSLVDGRRFESRI